jgi:ribosomal protein S18 acetylase RimI-like enzyme
VHLTIGAVAPAERDTVAALFAAAQVRPDRHICYLSLVAPAIGEELASLEPDGWDGVLVARAGDRLVGALGVEHDREPPRVWWHGPSVVADLPYAGVADRLLEEARRRLPTHVVEEELAGDDRHADLAELAARHGFTTATASAVLTRACAPAPDVPDAGVRAFADADRGAVAAIHDAAFPGAHLPGHRIDEGSDRFVLVAERAGTVAGYLAVDRFPDGTGYLDLLGVAPEARRAGVGAALVAAALRQLHREGIADAGLTVRETNHTARRLYDRLGFTEERLVRPFRRGFVLGEG